MLAKPSWRDPMADRSKTAKPAAPRGAGKPRANARKTASAKAGTSRAGSSATTTTPIPAAGPSAAMPATAVQAAHCKEAVMTTETPTETVAKAMEAVVPMMEKASAETMEQAKAQYALMNEKLTEMMEHSMKSITEMNEFAKGNLDALIASAKAATSGAETLTAAVVETSKKNFDEAQEMVKALATVKTPNEAMQLQSDFAKAQFEKTVAAWSHMSETMLKVTGEVFQPLSSRMAVAAETVKKAMAN
jgi:phasin family protein